MRNILSILIVVLIISCSSDKKRNIKVNQGNTRYLHLPESGEDTLNVSYFADTVLYVPLEATRESLLGVIQQVWINDSLILVSTWKEGLFLFRNDGKFIRKIGKKGKGPGEYLIIFRFDVLRDTIYISSSEKRGFQRYTFDGTFCDNIDLKHEPVLFSSTSDQKLVCYNDNEGKILVYQKGFHKADTIIGEYGVTKGRYYIGTRNSIHRPYFQKTQSGLLFNNYLSDTIWNIHGSTKEPAYIMDLKDELLPFEKQPEFYYDNVQKAMEIRKPYHSLHLIPFPSYNLIFQVQYSDYYYDAIYVEDIKTGEIKRFNTAFIYDDLVGKTKITAVFPDCSENYFAALAAWKSKDVEGGGKKYYNSPSPAWIKQMEPIDEEANPILVLVKLKKNSLE